MTDTEQEQIFKDWLSRCRALMFKIVRAYAHSDHDVDDLFQEIAIQVWRSIPGFRHESAITTWIYRIALNTAIKWKRKEQKHTAHEDVERLQHLLTATADAEDERLTWLYGEIRKLDGVDRSIALLLLEGLSYQEMADILGITKTNVGVKINRIKKQLISKSKTLLENGI
ncbi:MAG: RNA polymerase sigma factor [Bacteroidia bacterium]|nr:RNA polymerase sigma factor [Bacteroidia bacterium]